MIRVRYGIVHSQYSDDHETICFESEEEFEAHIRDLEKAAETLSDDTPIKPGTAIRVDDRDDVVYVAVVCHEATPADLTELPHVDDVDDDLGDASYWIEEIHGRQYVVREEYYSPVDQ